MSKEKYYNIAVKIYEELKAKGASIENASIPIIEKVLDRELSPSDIVENELRQIKDIEDSIHKEFGWTYFIEKRFTIIRNLLKQINDGK